MANNGQGHTIKEFPDVDNKLRAPTKKSHFEKQREEAERKRIREEAENAAALKEFQAEFDDDDDRGSGGYGQQGGYGGGGYGQSGFGGGRGPPSRGFERGPPSGPPSRGFGGGFGGPPARGPGSLGPPPPSMRGRGLEGFDRPLEPPQRKRDNDRRGMGFEDHHSRRSDQRPTDRSDRDRRKIPAAFSTSDDEDERMDTTYRKPAEPEVPKPTLQLNNLPPGTSPAAIKALLPSNLTVDGVRILPPPPSSSTATERKSISAIVTLSRETAASDIDTAVSSLRGNYLGYGHYLSLHRHLSTAALSSAPLPITHATTNVLPFGAKLVSVESTPQSTLNRQPPPGSYKGFAPPSSYTSSGPSKPLGPIMHVPVQPPSDIRELRLIHKTIELLLTHGPEFEALLMTRPDVQREEKWAWIWDARSKGGIWYRWRLWSLLTNSAQVKGKYVPLFEDAPAWKAPENGLPFEYATRLEEFVDDQDYVSSDDDLSDDETTKPVTGLGLAEDEGPKFLGPMQKAHLVHLLARLPPNVQKLRRGDVARITGFALKNSKQGANEVVEMLVANVIRPFSFTSANPGYKSRVTPPTSDGEGKEGKKEEDTSAASLVALRLIPDIIASALNSGVPAARNYRALFEAELGRKKVFEKLGRLEKRFGWGRMSSEKWKDAVKRELGRWKDGCLFMPGAPEAWLESFLKVDEEEKEKRRKEEEEKKRESKWKAVPDKVAGGTEVEAPTAMDVEDDVDGAPMEDEDVDGEPMDEYEDVDGEPMADSDEDVDGEAMAVDEDEQPVQEPQILPAESKVEEISRLKRQRPKAEDMFADSDSE